MPDSPPTNTTDPPLSLAALALSDSDPDPDPEPPLEPPHHPLPHPDFPSTVVPTNSLPSDDTVLLHADFPPDSSEIALVHLKIQSLAPLVPTLAAAYPQLTELTLRSNLIGSLSPLKALPQLAQLTHLDLYDNRIKHISQALLDASSLQVLDLSFNNIKHINNLQNLAHLTHLYLVQNRIKHLPAHGFPPVHVLQTLELAGNHLESLQNLPQCFPALTDLWLAQNKLSHLLHFPASLPRLRILSLQSNNLSAACLAQLPPLPCLEELYLADNNLVDLAQLPALPRLLTLDLTRTNLRRLPPLDRSPRLTDLWASYNLLDSFDNIQAGLAHCVHIDTVYFEGNPVQLANPALYRTKIKLALPKSLKKIDAMYINQ